MNNGNEWEPTANESGCCDILEIGVIDVEIDSFAIDVLKFQYQIS